MTTKIYYRTVGDVCGACDHHHRSIATAQACADQHQRQCSTGGGYSDRVVRRVDGAALEDWERDEIARAQGHLD